MNEKRFLEISKMGLIEVENLLTVEEMISYINMSRVKRGVTEMWGEHKNDDWEKYSDDLRNHLVSRCVSAIVTVNVLNLL